MNMRRSVAVLLVLLFPLLLFACGDSGGGGVVSSSNSSSGTFTINTSGADGGPAGGTGGDGGDVRIGMPFFGSMGSVEVLGSGAADASFTPTASIPNLGDIPLAITVDTTIAVVGAEPAVGTPYLVAGDPNLYISDGDLGIQDESPVTGISVAAGTTLTLDLNDFTDAYISLDNDVDNDGTITTVDFNATQRGNLILYLASYHGSGAIDTSGTLDGQHGGYVEMNLIYFFNRGSINTSGADNTGAAGGNGGDVDIYASYGIENTGNITADGGAASGALTSGGIGGSIELLAPHSIYNSGDLSCRGGDGVESGGSSNGMHFMVGEFGSEAGNFRNSGNLDTSGGAASGVGFGGGSGGSIDMYAYGGDIINSGNLTTKGGNATEPSSDGGSGGSISLYVYYGYLYVEVPPGDILFSGNVNASGGLAVTADGASGSGGSGGNFEIYADYENYPLGQRVALLGYAGIDASGGDANFGGGGGDVELSCEYGYDYQGLDLYTPSCNITNEASIDARGGSVVATATEGYGGSGGSVNIWTDEYYGMFDPDIDKVTNSGNIDTSSGSSLESDFSMGGAGSVWIWGYNGITNSGNITARGGHDLGSDGSDTGIGNDGNDVQLYADLGPVNNSGDLSTDGGDGEFAGGNAYAIELFGPEVSNSGALTANGGDADPLLALSTGGDGGTVELFSPDGMQGITQTGTVSNDGGTGVTPGSDGDYYLGGQLP
jgi:hypothetical protein